MIKTRKTVREMAMLYLILLGALIAGDQLLKYWTVTHLALGESAPLIPHIIRLTRLHNYGAAWSSLSGKTVLLLKKIVRHPLGVTACVLILGGGIGNMIDRIFRGYVVDMFDLLFMSYPIFNLADCFVVVGAILGAVYYLWLYEKYDKKEKPHADDADGNN